MQLKRRWQLAIGVMLLSFLISFWLGEQNAHLVPVDHALALLAAMCLTLCLLWRTSRMLAFCFSLLVLAGGGKAWSSGSHEHELALYDCLERCVHLQSALEAYRRSHGSYPASPEDLNLSLPGQVILPPQILKYKRTEERYSIWIADELMSYQGTQSKEFEAHK